jgi:Domain of unknown function (DUF4112)
MDCVDEFVVYLTVALVLLVLVGTAAYVIFRRIYVRGAERMADHIGQTLTEMSAAPFTSPFAGAGAAAARVVSGRLSNFGAYAASQGLSEEAARAEFTRSIERVAKAMDYAIRIPVIGGVGLDALLGLVPVAGDAASAAISLSLIARSARYGIPREIISRMLANVLVDLLLGAVPVIGDLADLWFKANQRNVALLKEYLGDEARNVIDVAAKTE